MNSRIDKIENDIKKAGVTYEKIRSRRQSIESYRGVGQGWPTPYGFERRAKKKNIYFMSSTYNDNVI